MHIFTIKIQIPAKISHFPEFCYYIYFTSNDPEPPLLYISPALQTETLYTSPSAVFLGRFLT
jgi:hypothetical protein